MNTSKLKRTRASMLAGDSTHREYYAQFVNQYMIDAVVRAIGAEKILKSDDPHFNDIALRHWDRIGCCFVRGGFSLSDCVCTVKEAAHQYVEQRARRRP